MQEKSARVSFKAGPEDGLAEGEFIVYPSTFTREPDAYGDVVAKGAFSETIENWKASGNVLPGLFGHRMDDPDYYVAEAIDMGEDDHGWWVKGRFDLDSPKGPQVYRLVKGKRITQLSFAYDVLEGQTVDLEDGSKANELQKLHVYEFSFVPVGANRDTSVLAVKSAIEVLEKAGRVLSASNESLLRDAHESIGKVLSALESDDADSGQEDEASDTEPVKDALEHDGAKSDAPEPIRGSSADAYLAVIKTMERY